MKKVIVTGGRDYGDLAMMDDVLDTIQPDIVIQGGANGADFHARSWASDRGVECVTYNADWSEYGKSAGPIRNIQMLEENPDAVVVAFPGGKGTANMIKEAKLRNRVVLQVL